MTSKPSRAIAETLPRLSPVWLIPLAALLIGLWLAFDHLSGHCLLYTSDAADEL